MKKRFAWLVALVIAATPTTAATAVENGVSAAGDNRIVAIYKGSENLGLTWIQFPMCSAYLISNRIAVTAQHCTMDRETDGPRDISTLFVGLPGSKTTLEKGNHTAVSAIFRAKNFKFYDIRTDLSYQNDVAVLVLSKPIAGVSNAKLLNEKEFLEFVAQDPEVWIGGYGYQTVEERSVIADARRIFPAKAPARFAADKDYRAAMSELKAKWGRTNYQESLVGLSMPASTGTICDVDSGAGFWSKSDTQTIYLGVMNGPLGGPNCQGQPPIWPITFNGVHPTYKYQNLFDSASAYVKAHPVNSTVTCKKGKLTKRITAANPKCPAGYKKS